MKKYLLHVVFLLICISTTFSADRLVPSVYSDIESAIVASSTGDVIILSEGKYYENIYIDKDIILRSTDPDDWSVVQNTIIDGGGLGAAVVIDETVSSSCQIKGITIQNGGQTEDLICHFKLDEVLFDDPDYYVDDSSLSGGHIGTLSSMTDTACDDGKLGKRLDFDGTDDYVDIPYSSDLDFEDDDPFSICMWLNPDVLTTYATFISSALANSNPGERLTVDWRNNLIWVSYGNGTTATGYTSAASSFVNDTTRIGKWSHVAITYDGTDLKIYIDGTQSGSTHSTNSDLASQSAGWQIGTGYRGTDWNWDGKIDDVRFYKRKLTASEVSKIAEIEPDIHGHWNLDENVEDYISGVSGTLNNEDTGTSYVPGLFGGRACNFNGYGDSDGGSDSSYAVINGSVYPRLRYSISLWMRTSVTEGSMPILTKNISTSLDYGSPDIRIEDGTIKVSSSGVENQFISSTDDGYADGQWHHIACTFNYSTKDVNLYVDGQHQATTTSYTVYLFTLTPGNTKLAAWLSNAEYFTGDIDDIRIFKEELSEEHILQLASAGCGIYGSGSEAGIINCQIKNNHSGFKGGGVRDCDGLISNCVFTGNTASISDDEIADCDGTIELCLNNENLGNIFATSFEETQGFYSSTDYPETATDIDSLDDWSETGGDITDAVFYDQGPVAYEYQYVNLPYNSSSSNTISRHFDSIGGSAKQYIRLSCIPSDDCMIEIKDDFNSSDQLIAGVKIVSNSTIQVLNNGTYTDSDMTWSSFSTLRNACLTSLGKGSGDAGTYDYEDCWMEIEIYLKWNVQQYDVTIKIWNGNGYTSHSVDTDISFDQSSTLARYTDIIATNNMTSSSTYSDFKLNRLSAANDDTFGGVIGDDVYCTHPSTETPLSGTCDIAGKIWYYGLGEYKLLTMPVDSDSDDWVLLATGSGPKENALIGQIDTRQFKSGDMYLKFEIYDDIGRLQEDDNDGILTKEITYREDDGGLNIVTEEVLATYSITGLGKGQSYHHEEKPDITVNWPGSFPFEFKRIYDDSLKTYLYPLFFGWTHNHNIRIIENCTNDWAKDSSGNPESDGNGLGLGTIWLQQGASCRMFVPDFEDTTYNGIRYYYSVDNINGRKEYIVRLNSGPINEVYGVCYGYQAADGLQYAFGDAINKISIEPGYTPYSPDGAVNWQIVKGIDKQADRYGNALIYTWEATAEKYITKIENNRTDAELQFLYTMDDASAIVGVSDLCEQVLLSDGTTSEPIMQFSMPSSLYYVTKKRTETSSAAWTYANSFMYELNDNSLVIDKIVFPSIIDGIPYTTPPEICIDRYSDGSLKEVCKLVPSGSHRNWIFGARDLFTYVENYSYEYDLDNNMTMSILYEIDTDYDDASLKTVKKTFSPGGALTKEYTTTYSTSLDPYYYKDAGPFWCGTGGADSWSTGGGGVKDIRYVYGDSRFPFKPTIIIESVDDEGTGAAKTNPTYYETIKKTVYQYDEYGNVVSEKKYIDDDNFVYTEYDHHQEYNLLIEKTTYTGYCYDSGSSVVTSGKEVVSKWLYDEDPDGTPGTGDTGDYLVQEEVLLDDMDTPATPGDDQWAVTEYVYNTYGKVISKTDPENNITFFQYDSNGFVQRVWLDATLSLGQPVGNPQKRVYTNAIGFIELEADHAGKVTMNLLDACGRTVEARTYFDDIAMERPTEAEYLGTGDLPFEPDTYSSFTIQTNVLFSSFNSYDKPELVKMAKYYDGQQEYQRAEIEYNYFIDGESIVNIEYSSNDEFWTGYHFSFEPLPLVQKSSLADSYQDSNKYYVYDSMNRLCHEYEYNYHPSYASQHPNPFIKHTVYEYYGSGQKSSEAVYKVLRVSSTVFDDELEKYITYEYDVLDRLTKQVVYASGTGSQDTCTVTEYEYDALGNSTCVVTYEGNVTNPDMDVVFTDYDNAGRKIIEYLAEELDTDLDTTYGNAVVKTTISYDLNGKITDIVSYDYDGTTSLAEKSMTYDGRGRITSVTQAETATTDLVTYYDYRDEADSNLSGQPESGLHIKVTDPNDKVTWIGLTPHKKIAKVIYPSGDYEEMEYYGHGLIKQKRVWDGTTALWIEYEYDEFGKLALMDYPGTGGYLTYDYTTRLLGELGEVETITDYRHADDRPGSSESTYEFEYYNYSGNLLSYKNYDGYTVTYDYNTAYNLKSNVTVTDNSTPTPAVIYSVDYTYDMAGQMTQIVDSSGATDQYIAGMGYDYSGNLTDLDYYLEGTLAGESYGVNIDYNIDNFLLKISSAVYPEFLWDTEDEVDGLGRASYATENIETQTFPTPAVRDSHDYDYYYDMLSQVTGASVSNINGSTWTTALTYQDDGNLDTETVNSSSTGTIKYSSGDLMTKKSGDTLAWDNNGQLTTGINGIDIEYNWDGKVRKVEDSQNVELMSVKYDPMGNRVYKDGDRTRKYIVDIVGKLPVIICELDPDDYDAVTNKYIYKNTQIIYQYDADESHEESYYVYDRQGSVRLVLGYDEYDAYTKNSYVYGPFGNVLPGENNENVYNPFKFTGQWYDDEIDQYYMRARMYDPVMMRFTTRDSVRGDQENPLSIHKYLYCWNNPVNCVDPSGKLGEYSLMRDLSRATTAHAQAIGAVGYWVESGNDAFLELGLVLQEMSAEMFHDALWDNLDTYIIGSGLSVIDAGLGTNLMEMETTMETVLFFSIHGHSSGTRDSYFVREVWHQAYHRSGNYDISINEFNDYMDWLY